MQKKIYAFTILVFTLCISIFVVIAPTFFSKELSRVELHQEINLELLLNTTQEIEIVFFGYAGCVNICTPRLQDIAKFYETLSLDEQTKVGIVFADISVPLNKILPHEFASFFHPSFRGLFLNQQVLREYTKVFNVYFSQSLMDSSEFDHTSNLYIIKREKSKKELRYIYKSYPFDFKQIHSDIQGLLYERD